MVTPETNAARLQRSQHAMRRGSGVWAMLIARSTVRASGRSSIAPPETRRASRLQLISVALYECGAALRCGNRVLGVCSRAAKDRRNAREWLALHHLPSRSLCAAIAIKRSNMRAQRCPICSEEGPFYDDAARPAVVHARHGRGGSGGRPLGYAIMFERRGRVLYPFMVAAGRRRWARARAALGPANLTVV